MYIKNNNIVERTVYDSIFLIDITDNYMNEICELYEINQIGLFIWNNIETSSDAKEITEKLIDELVDKVEYEVVYEDVCLYVDTLKNQGFITEVGNE